MKSKNPVRVIVIIFAVILGLLILLKACGSSVSNTTMVKSPNNAVISFSSEYSNVYYPKESFTGTSSLFTTLVGNSFISFNDGSNLICESNSGIVNFVVVDSNGGRFPISSYTYSNYTYTHSMSSVYSLNFGGYTANSYDVSGTSYDFTNFFSTTNNITGRDVFPYYIVLDDDYSYPYGVGLDEGVSKGIQQVLNDPSTYNLYTQEEYTTYGETMDNHGYLRGYSAGASADIMESGYKPLLNTIISAPYNLLKGMFNFEFIGINLFNLLSFLFTTLLIGWFIKKFAR